VDEKVACPIVALQMFLRLGLTKGYMAGSISKQWFLEGLCNLLPERGTSRTERISQVDNTETGVMVI